VRKCLKIDIMMHVEVGCLKIPRVKQFFFKMDRKKCGRTGSHRLLPPAWTSWTPTREIGIDSDVPLAWQAGEGIS
jgi:hypothetical protein